MKISHNLKQDTSSEKKIVHKQLKSETKQMKEGNVKNKTYLTIN